MDESILLTDGVCNLCNASVRFVLRRERTASLQFASLQSSVGHELLDRFDIDAEILDTLVLIEGDRVRIKSDAVLGVTRHLRAPWRWARVLGVIPRPIRDWLYDRVARLRYRVFGKSHACPVPTEAQSARFLDADERQAGLS